MTEETLNRIADNLHKWMGNLGKKEGHIWIHSEKGFLPANVQCDFVGVVKFKDGIKRIIKESID